LNKANFCHAVELFIIKALHETKPQDWQYIYMMPSGDYNAWKKIKTSPINHFHQSEEMMCIAGLLPVGNIPTPNTQLQVESTGLIMQSTCNPGASFTMRCYRLLWSTSSQSTRLVRMMEACSTISISLKGSSRSKA
jgi:hypothetical protein